MTRNKIRILLRTALTAITLLTGCTCRASVKPTPTTAPTGAATMVPEATAVITVVPTQSASPLASAAVSPSASSMTTEGTGSGTP